MIRKAQFLVGVVALILLLVLLAAHSNSAPTGSQVRQGSSTGRSTTVSSSPTSSSIGSIMIPAHPTVAPSRPTATSTPKLLPTATSGTGSQGTGSGNGTTTIPTSLELQAAQAVFTLINQERAGQGLPAFMWSTKLVSSAHTHNLTMLSANKLSHQLPGEPNFGMRITNAGLIWSSAAENIGYSSAGNPTNAAVGLNQSMFAEKPPDDGHRVNILSANTLIGIDVVQNPQNQQIWLTEDFAKPL